MRGKELPKPEALASDERQPWKHCEAQLYGKWQRVAYKTCVAQWYRACGERLLRVVVVRVEEGSIGVRVFLSTTRICRCDKSWKAMRAGGRSRCASGT